MDKNGVIQTFGASGASAPYGPRYLKTGYSYGTISLGTYTNSSLPTNNLMYATPIYIPTATTITQLSMYLQTGAGTTVQGFRYCLYNNSTTDDYPTTKVAGSDNYMETSTTLGTTGWNAAIVSISLNAGLYWLAAVRQATNAPTVLSLSAGIAGNQVLPFYDNTGSTSPAVAWTQAGVTGTMPATFSGTKIATSGVVPAVFIGV